ncbi:iron ABC transporter substrate-binding protein [Thermodesulforhabdus norvegica]|uniref:Iron complex transport system substrate-binding protein n=1 Tax=Thermodesulforhabdus norvegica TaxID=39841 RepID=A0A1I4UY25_9BACT|nr:iron ABC transporter substrate-binding protein [Thermodesulforhabdus norvegica]SFM93818.1 iron complex transport system substrate-binding protein [Thermodesulforhabdus norvegica]
MRRSLIAMVLLCAAVTRGLAAASEVFEDMASRRVKIPEKPGRIVCIGPGALRLIVYLNAQDMVVGVEEMEKRSPRGRPYWMAHPELGRLPVIGPGGPQSINTKPDLEPILRVKPDVIFVTYMDGKLAEHVQRLSGIPVVVLSYGAFATFEREVLDSILLAGKILGKEGRARQIVEYVAALKKDLESRTASNPRGNNLCVYVGGVGHRGAHGIESTELNYIPFVWTGIRNCAEKVQSRVGTHLFVDKEALLSIDPDVIFIDGGGLSLVLEDFRKHREFYEALKAYKDRRIYTLFPFNFYTTNVETALIDAYAVGKILFPDRFEDVDLKSKADEIYTFFVGASLYDQMAEDYGALGANPPFWDQTRD